MAKGVRKGTKAMPRMKKAVAKSKVPSKKSVEVPPRMPGAMHGSFSKFS